MTRPTPITLNDFLDWAERKGVPTDIVPQEELQDAIDRGNRIEQEIIQEKETRRASAREVNKP